MWQHHSTVYSKAKVFVEGNSFNNYINNLILKNRTKIIKSLSFS